MARELGALLAELLGEGTVGEDEAAGAADGLGEHARHDINLAQGAVVTRVFPVVEGALARGAKSHEGMSLVDEQAEVIDFLKGEDGGAGRNGALHTVDTFDGDTDQSGGVLLLVHAEFEL